MSAIDHAPVSAFPNDVSLRSGLNTRSTCRFNGRIRTNLFSVLAHGPAGKRAGSKNTSSPRRCGEREARISAKVIFWRVRRPWPIKARADARQRPCPSGMLISRRAIRSESLLTVALYRAGRRGTVSRTATIGDACKLSILLIR
jgi:hypothetical protein